MIIKFDDSTIHARVIEESTNVSKHTGMTLLSNTIEIVIQGETENDHFVSWMKSNKKDGITSLDENHDPVAKWEVGNYSWSHTQGSPVYHHTILITQMEDLDLEKLTIGNLTLRPYEYKERFDGDSLIIEAKAVLSDDEFHQLKSMQQSNDDHIVIRHGINQELVQMRFGLCYWSKNDSGIKHEITLVDAGLEKGPGLMSAFQWMVPVRNQAASNKASIDVLLDMLVSRDILIENDVAQLRAEAETQRRETIYGFYQVDDIDNR